MRRALCARCKRLIGRCGEESGTLQASGFTTVAARRREHPNYDLWTLATKATLDDTALRTLAAVHFPG